MCVYLMMLMLILYVSGPDGNRDEGAMRRSEGSGPVYRCSALFYCLHRLFILGSYDKEMHVHCTVELSGQQWKEKTRSSIKQVPAPLDPVLLSNQRLNPVTSPGNSAVHRDVTHCPHFLDTHTLTHSWVTLADPVPFHAS